MKKVLSAMLAAFLIVGLGDALAEEKKSREEKKAEEAASKRAEIDKVAGEALQQVLAKSEKAKGAYGKAAGWAVFDNMRVTFILSGGGSGVAVNKASGARTCMKMGTGGLSIGIGAQKYQAIMLFETAKVLNDFIAKGWKAETGANAAAGQKGANVEAEFINGMAIYQITEKGLMASADVSGTKYWVDEDLNKKQAGRNPIRSGTACVYSIPDFGFAILQPSSATRVQLPSLIPRDISCAQVIRAGILCPVSSIV